MTLVRAEDVVAAARGWLGTPFHHQARVRGVGVDCIGLVVGVARELGLSVQDRTDYGRRPDGRLQEELEQQLEAVDALEVGAVLLFRLLHDPQHVAIYAGGWRIIHALDRVGRVVEHSLDTAWRQRLVAVYRIPGVLA